MFTRMLQLPLQGKSSLFLFGPRGTGKTSWIKAHMPNSLYLDLLEYATFTTLQRDPQRLEKLIPSDYTDWIIIDEVQRVPELLNEVHRLIEKKKLRFLLTGSSARSLRRKGVNLLAGRALMYYMHPLIVQEMGDAFSLPHALQFGLLPEVTVNDNPRRYLESYIQSAIRGEVLHEQLTRKIDAFSNFIEVASFSQGQVLNLSEIARELNVNRLTVGSYFDILTDLLVGVRIMPFTKRAKRRMIAHQKFFFFDSGIFMAARPRGLLDSLPEAEGAGLETLFLQSVRALNDYLGLGYSIYFWRTVAGDEVDFVLYGPRGFHAFEIKRTTTVHTKDLKGLRCFLDDYPEAKGHFCYLGNLREYHGSLTAVPFVEMLKSLPTILS